MTPIEQQTVLLSVSRSNECQYCLAAHSMLARNIAKMDVQSIEKLKAGLPLEDKKLQALSVFSEKSVILLSKSKSLYAFLIQELMLL